MSDVRDREKRLSRLADGRGLRLEKSHRRVMVATESGGYMLSDPYNNDEVVLGGGLYTYTATLDDIEDYLKHGAE